MSGLNRILPVPYFVQPTAVTCQSTCLKMFATYLERSVVQQSTAAGAREIPAIWKDINQDPRRPVKVLNAHGNMKWWLERHFPRLKFDYSVVADEARAIDSIVPFIDGGFPVMVSISHARVAGHIILVVGYEGYTRGVSSPEFKLVVHDPYGRFDPTLLSTTFGKRRWEGGQSLASGGQAGPGQNNRVVVSGVGRQRTGDARIGTYYLLSARH
ncbi:MAG TPA: C39 family peptidase [Longimicrobiales bacterium]|nr:C39 family peptidase [Longimicrobiales bacterium]